MPKLSTICLFLLCLSGRISAQQQQPSEDDTRAMIKANFLYQFASSNEWPADSKKGKFTIGIYGNSSLYEQLASRYGSKPVGSQTLEIVELKEVTDDRVFHIIYVDRSKKNEMPEVIQKIKGKSTLIITHFDGALALGSAINFREVNSNIRYELNKKAADDRRINLGTKILQWAVVQ
ncbi:MAG: YfiR family protein [Flavobacteriales bacterium]|nr:YfiR family protein [Flavobacteriales bacterium]